MLYRYLIQCKFRSRINYCCVAKLFALYYIIQTILARLLNKNDPGSSHKVTHQTRHPLGTE